MRCLRSEETARNNFGWKSREECQTAKFKDKSRPLRGQKISWMLPVACLSFTECHLSPLGNMIDRDWEIQLIRRKDQNYFCDAGTRCQLLTWDRIVCGWTKPVRGRTLRGCVADFPAVFFHISNFDICHEIQLTDTKTKPVRGRTLRGCK